MYLCVSLYIFGLSELLTELMKKLLIICTLFFSTLAVLGQDDPKTAAAKLGPNPVFIIDSKKVSQSDLSKYSLDSIATVVTANLQLN